ncbi:hypothetical protein EUGRSUZ_F03756 [Eucalyptus grandis]|uniref:Uncharacterized protein n=2 Tax=Eucalyptus grandis TaxID=71139 RepID=A0ACC3KNE0_EUCGR|nr:hypothetical protein EUGRSUZ_F03756 [Eucalyptus grandis]
MHSLFNLTSRKERGLDNCPPEDESEKLQNNVLGQVKDFLQREKNHHFRWKRPSVILKIKRRPPSNPLDQPHIRLEN